MSNYLSPTELKNLYKFQVWTRPMLVYIMGFILFFVSITTMYLIVTGQERLTDASGILMCIIGVIAPVLTSIVLGRSYEKAKGRGNSDDVPDSLKPPQELPDEIENPFDSNNPFETLKHMNLDEFKPKKADDEPSV